MVPLILTCFGEFQVVLDGVPLINFQTDKVRAFLIYLALEARPHTRIDLAQFLWPGYSTESANNSLRQTLHRLRQLLKEGKRDLFWLLSTRQTVQINPAAPVVVDVLTFRNLLAHCKAHDHEQLLTCQPCLARLQQAVDLYRGDFLANFTVADSNPFEEWRRITQEQLHLQVLDALTQLGYAAETAGDDEAAQRAAQRQLDLEPWLESAHRLIMRVLARRGQRAAALAQYQQCCQVLGDEFSVEPEVETRELWEAIQSSRFQRGTENVAYAPSATLNLSEGAPKAQPVARPRTLPLVAAPLIGRDEALAEITTLLQQPAVRLLTLVGAGGMGKTRLAIEVGRTAEARFANGICFVELAAIHTPSALAAAIATALGIPLQGGEPRELLLQALRQQQLLLILDNFEQLLGEENTVVDLVGDLLMAAPAVQILVTSRERLKLRYEQIYAIPALAFAPAATLADAANMAAVRLFVQAAQCSQPHFQLTDANLATVLRICWLVQGMPLGLELAAANIDQLPPAAIADALAQSAEVLAMDWRDLPERQRSMRAVFAWSWQLLSAPEQRILCQSAVFRGGFTYGAAQAVTGATLPLLARLTDKSLLQWQVTATGERRYTMHELLRQFADEELHASGDHPVIAERHGHYYLAYLTERGPRLARSEPQEASNEILTELDNVRQAWQWAVTECRMVELDQATYSWWQFCQFSDRTAEGRQRFEAAVAGVRQYLARLSDARAAATTAATTQLAQQLLAKLLAIHADYLFAQGRDQEMAAQADEAIRLGAESGGIEGETFGTFVRGRAAQELGQLQEAGDLWRRTLQLVTTYQPAYPESELLHEAHWMAHNWLRGNELGFGQHLSSRAHMVQALQICQALGKRRGELYCLSDLAWTDFYLFDFATAEPGFHAALALANDLGYRRSEMIVQAGLGEVLRVRGDYRQAQALMQQAAAVAAELALPYNETHILALLARLHCQLGNQSAGILHLERLAQLLEQHKLPAECHLHHALATAISAHYAIDIEAALSWAEVALDLHKQCEVPFRLVDTMLILGHTRTAAGQWESAAAAFQQALTTLQQFGNQPLAAEAQAGLAQIALAQGELASAQAQLEAFLPVLDEQSRAGYNNPFFLYLIGYRVLTANGDPRATALLQHGYTLLHEDAATLDGESRQRFLTDVPIHRELIAAWKTLQQQEEASGTVASGTVASGTVDSGRVARRAVGQSDGGESDGGESDEAGAPLSLYDWGEMPGVAFFSGRAAEVAQLTGWLVPKANTPLVRLISIFGLGGMGKTTLAARVVKTLAPSFTVVIWRSLLNAPPLEELLRDWLQRLAHQHWATIPQSLDEQLRLLVDYLRQARCLLVLDNFESLFAGEEMPGLVGAMRAGYEGYDQLLQRLATVEHQSTLLLTSREQPYALNHLGRQAQVEGGPLRVLRLGGLDAQAGHHFLQSNGLVASADEVASLVENYSGNPLALQIAAATIADFFGGDVVAFRREEGNLFDGIRLVLEQQFARLTSLERDILVWLTIERQEATPATLRADFVQAVPTNVLLEALHALQSRSLIEARDGKLLLQNVIIEYTTAYLIEQVYQEIADGKMTRWQDEKINATADHAFIQWEPTGRGHLVTLSFLNRFALLKAQAKEYVRQSQQRLILQPLADRLRAQHSEAQLCLLVQGLLETLRQHTPQRRGMPLAICSTCCSAWTLIWLPMTSRGSRSGKRICAT